MTPPKIAFAGLAVVFAPFASAATTYALVEANGTYTFDRFESDQPGTVVSSSPVSGLIGSFWQAGTS